MSLYTIYLGPSLDEIRQNPTAKWDSRLIYPFDFSSSWESQTGLDGISLDSARIQKPNRNLKPSVNTDRVSTQERDNVDVFDDYEVEGENEEEDQPIPGPSSKGRYIMEMERQRVWNRGGSPSFLENSLRQELTTGDWLSRREMQELSEDQMMVIEGRQKWTPPPKRHCISRTTLPTDQNPASHLLQPSKFDLAIDQYQQRSTSPSPIFSCNHRESPNPSSPLISTSANLSSPASNEQIKDEAADTLLLLSGLCDSTIHANFNKSVNGDRRREEVKVRGGRGGEGIGEAELGREEAGKRPNTDPWGDSMLSSLNTTTTTYANLSRNQEFSVHSNEASMMKDQSENTDQLLTDSTINPWPLSLNPAPRPDFNLDPNLNLTPNLVPNPNHVHSSNFVFESGRTRPPRSLDREEIIRLTNRQPYSDKPDEINTSQADLVKEWRKSAIFEKAEMMKLRLAGVMDVPEHLSDDEDGGIETESWKDKGKRKEKEKEKGKKIGLNGRQHHEREQVQEYVDGHECERGFGINGNDEYSKEEKRRKLDDITGEWSKTGYISQLASVIVDGIRDNTVNNINNNDRRNDNDPHVNNIHVIDKRTNIVTTSNNRLSTSTNHNRRMIHMTDGTTTRDTYKSGKFVKNAEKLNDTEKTKNNLNSNGNSNSRFSTSNGVVTNHKNSGGTHVTGSIMTPTTNSNGRISSDFDPQPNTKSPIKNRMTEIATTATFTSTKTAHPIPSSSISNLPSFSIPLHRLTTLSTLLLRPTRPTQPLSQTQTLMVCVLSDLTTKTLHTHKSRWGAKWMVMAPEFKVDPVTGKEVAVYENQWSKSGVRQSMISCWVKLDQIVTKACEHVRIGDVVLLESGEFNPPKGNKGATIILSARLRSQVTILFRLKPRCEKDVTENGSKHVNNLEKFTASERISSSSIIAEDQKFRPDLRVTSDPASRKVSEFSRWAASWVGGVGPG